MCPNHKNLSLHHKNNRAKEKIKSWPAIRLKYIYLTLAVVCTATYSNGIFGEFVHDDIITVQNNPDVLGEKELWRVFTNDFWGKPISETSSHKSYRPITILTFRLEKYLLGSTSPICCHLVNVGLHLGVTLTYTKVLHSCLHLSDLHVLTSGLIFSVHPIHTEAVTGIVGRADLLASIFFLASFYSYNRMLCLNGVHSFQWLLSFVMAVIIGVLCKETALTVVGVCAAWDVFLFRKTYKSPQEGINSGVLTITKRIGILSFMASVILILRLLIMRGSPSFSKQDNPVSFNKSFQTRLLTFSYLPALNSWLLFNPWCLSHDWQMGSLLPVTKLFDWRNVASLAFYIILLALLFQGFRSKNKFGCSIFWSVMITMLSYLPASNVLYPVGFVVAERILYLPSLGFCTIISLGLLKIWRKSLDTKKNFLRNYQQLSLILFVFVFSVFFLKSIRRNTDWLSRESLLRSGLQIMPNNAKIHYNYANLAKDKEDFETAISHYLRAISLWPEYPSAHNNLGVVLLERNEISAAEMHFKLALRHQDNHLHATTNLAMLLRCQHRMDEAIGLLHEFLHHKTDFHSLPYQNRPEEIVTLGLTLGALYNSINAYRSEEEVLLKLMTEYPLFVEVQAHYGDFLSRQDRLNEALKLYEAALSLDPLHNHSLTSYATLLDKRLNHNEAKYFYKKALDVSWDPDTAASLANNLFLQGNITEAEDIAVQILAYRPNHLGASLCLVQIKIERGQLIESEHILNVLLSQEPNHIHANYHLSVILDKTNRKEQSIAKARIAADSCHTPKDFCAWLFAHLADLLHTTAMLDSAVQSYQTAINLEPSLVKAHLNLGAIYHIQGNYSNALEHYSEALVYDPSNSLLLENIWKLRRIYKETSDIIVEG